jgi:glyoxylase-like metal-dependent hydrolase (beta-lactamase superfamily II)
MTAATPPGRPQAAIGGWATARALCVLAPNASPMTLDGTNTWIVAEPDSPLAVVIDPGPLDEGHLKNVVAAAERAGKRVALTLLTHGHPDHAEGAARFAELTGTRVRALDPALRLGEEGLTAGDTVTTGGLELRVIPTPGHTADSLTFHLPADGAVLTGDTVLGRGTTMVAHPDGRLGDYLDSLRRLQSLTVEGGVDTVLPGHGPVLADARGAVEFYLAHRANRLAQVETPSRPATGPPPTSSPTSTPTWTARCGRPPSCRSAPSSTTCVNTD